jgi:hypothetical protein
MWVYTGQAVHVEVGTQTFRYKDTHVYKIDGITDDSRCMHFRCPRLRICAVYFSTLRSINTLSAAKFRAYYACVEPSPGLSKNVMQMTREATRDSGASLTSILRLLAIRFPLYAFSVGLCTVTCRNATPAYNEKYLYILYN